MVRYCGLGVALFLLGDGVSKTRICILKNSYYRILLPDLYCTQLLFQCRIYNPRIFVDQAIRFVQRAIAHRNWCDRAIACSTSDVPQPQLFYSWSNAASTASTVLQVRIEYFNLGYTNHWRKISY